jgi:integrase
VVNNGAQQVLFRLVRPLRRKASRYLYFVQRIPADVRRQLTSNLTLTIPVGDGFQKATMRPGSSDIRFSLRTADPSEWKVRHAAVAAHLEKVWRALRQSKPLSLNHRQVVSLAQELYRAWANGDGREIKLSIEHDPDSLRPEDHIRNKAGKLTEWRRVSATYVEPRAWKAALAHLEKVSDTVEPQDLETSFGALVDRVLLSKGIGQVDAPTREMLLIEFTRALRDAFESRKRNAKGDYSVDAKASRFPEWMPLEAAQEARGSGGSLKALVEAWWVEARMTGLKASTYDSYRRTMAALVGFLGHDDADRVTRDDVVRFKDHRRGSVNPRTGKPISPRTVKDSDLAGLKSVFGWAVVNGKMASNPAEGVTIKLGKKAKARRGLNDAEAVAILQKASALALGKERPETFAAKRWVPWLLAYTGARVGEMAQLRKEDVRQEGDFWTVTITPDAGTVKSGETRLVVLHPHLVELGFVAFVKHAKTGHLFMRESGASTIDGQLRGLKNRIAEFVRKVVSDTGGNSDAVAAI